MNRMVSIVAIIFIGVLGTPVFGEDLSKPSSKKSMGKKSTDRHLYLYQKDPTTWLRIKNGAWGKLTFNEYSTKFVLDARGLVPHMAYALIRATGPRPYAHVVARGTSDNKGHLYLRGFWPEWTLRFWVVKGDDVIGKPGDIGPGSLDTFKAWNPKHYLFESEVL